jgi:hypothetical protein
MAAVQTLSFNFQFDSYKWWTMKYEYEIWYGDCL